MLIQREGDVIERTEFVRSEVRRGEVHLIVRDSGGSLVRVTLGVEEAEAVADEVRKMADAEAEEERMLVGEAG